MSLTTPKPREKERNRERGIAWTVGREIKHKLQCLKEMLFVGSLMLHVPFLLPLLSFLFYIETILRSISTSKNKQVSENQIHVW